MFLVPVEPD